MKPQILSIDVLKLDGGTQNRVSTNEETVEEYAELIADSNGEWPFPPLDVFHDGIDHFVADGIHRTLGAQKAKRASIPCRVHKGTAKDARIFGMTANDKHGLRMTRADKRGCVEWLLENGGKMTQKEIAEKSGVTTRFVRYLLAERQGKKRNSSAEQTNTYKGEPGGGSAASSNPTPAADGPASSAAIEHESARSAKAEKGEQNGIESGELPPADSETGATPETPRNGREPKDGPGESRIPVETLVDNLFKQHIGHVSRGVLSVAEANGGEGEQFQRADAGLNQLIEALGEMRKGKP